MIYIGDEKHKHERDQRYVLIEYKYQSGEMTQT